MASILFLLFFFSFFFLFLVSPSTSITPASEISALKSLKDSVDPTSIPQGSCLSTWDFSLDLDPCDSLFSPHFTCAIRCDADPRDLNLSHVTSISLDPASYSSSSSIPSPIFLSLPFLQSLDLADNLFSGTLPSLPSSLRLLSLSRNSFSGPVPALPSSLTELYLDNNYFDGNFTDQLSSLNQLRRLELQRNNLTGQIPDLTSLTNLNYFHASDNFFTGQLTANLFPSSLVEISLRNNKLYGQLDGAAVARLENLQVLDLSRNGLTGPVPKELFEHPSLEQLNLEYNQFEWIEEPRGNGRLLPPPPSFLIELDLGHNRLTGLLPGFIGSMPQLSAVDLEDNKFTGMIPVQYAMRVVGVDEGGVAQFGRLLLSGNYLFGPIPSPLVGGLKEGMGGEVSLADNCLFRCPSIFFFCEGGVQKDSSTCREFNPVIP